jgi:hypothetical protein
MIKAKNNSPPIAPPMTAPREEACCASSCALPGDSEAVGAEPTSVSEKEKISGDVVWLARALLVEFPKCPEDESIGEEDGGRLFVGPVGF